MLSFSALAQQPAFLRNGLIAYFPFDGNAKVVSGNGKKVSATAADFPWKVWWWARVKMDGGKALEPYNANTPQLPCLYISDSNE